MLITEKTSVSLFESKWNLKTLFYLGTTLFLITAFTPAYAGDEGEDLAAPQSNWSGYLGLGYSQNSYDSDSYDSSKSYNFTARIKYADSWGDIRLTGGGDKQLQHGKESSLYDPFLEYRLPIYELSETVSIRGTAGVYIPLSETSKKNHLEYAPRIAAYLYWEPIDPLSFYIAPRYRYNAYRYETSGQVVLPEHQVEILADAYWQITPAWYFEFSGSYKRARNYNGRKMDGKYNSTQEFGWEFLDSWELAMGHTNSGNIFNYDVGPSHSYELYDKKDSQFYLSVTKYL